MARRRSKGNESRPPQQAANDFPWGRLAGVLIVILLLLPFGFVGNQYPPAVFVYWAVGTLILALAVAIPDGWVAPLARLRQRTFGLLPDGGWGAIAAILAFGLSLAIAVFVFKKSANTPDEIAQYWHSRVLASGRMSLPVDPNREFFGLETVVDVGRWYSQFPIGGPLSLVPGAVVGAPWLVNPVLAGVATLILYFFGRSVYNTEDARRASLIFATLAMTVFMAGTWMNHVPTMALAVAAVWGLSFWDRSNASGSRAKAAVGIGLSLGLMATIRPLDAIAVAVPIGVFQVISARGDPRRFDSLVIQVAAGLLGVAPLLIANAATTGSPLVFGYDVLWGPGHRVGFHTDPYGRAHTLAGAVELLLSYLGELNLYLGAWPVPILLVVAASLWFARRLSKWDALAVGLFASQVTAYALYWGEGSFLGPRFLYTAVPWLAILLARLPTHVAATFGSEAGSRAARGLVIAVLAAWLVPGVEFNALGLARQAAHARTNLRVDYSAVVRNAGVHNAVIVLHEPFTTRLARRLWGVGALRSDAAQLVATRDACVLHDSLTVVEREGRRGAAAARAIISIPPFDASRGREVTADPRALVLSREFISSSCAEELAADRQLGFAPFGPALPLEPLTADGRVDGDVIYVADLGVHNAALQLRFAGRRWYRLVLQPDGGDRLIGRLIDY